MLRRRAAGLQGSINPLLRRVDPALPTINSVPEMLRCFAAWHLGVAPFLPLAWLNGNASVLGVPADRYTLYSLLSFVATTTSAFSFF